MAFSGAFVKPFRPAFDAGLAAAVAIRIHDTFTDADATVLSAHAISPINTPATAWTNDTSEPGMRILSNVAASNGVNLSRCDAGIANCTVRGTFTFSVVSGSHSAALCVRQTNNANYWMIRLINGVFAIIEMTASVVTSRASAAVTTTAGVAYIIEVVLAGSSIIATVNGGSQLSYNSASHQAVTNHGMRLVNLTAGAVYMDDFIVF